MSETFADLIKRLSRYEGLDWMDREICPDKETAVNAVQSYIRAFENSIPDFWLKNSADFALGESLNFGSGAQVTDTADSRRHWAENFSCRRWLDDAYCVDWGDTESITEVLYQGGSTKDQNWHPTEQDYRECCGAWRDDDAPTVILRVPPEYLATFGSRSDFDSYYKLDGFTKIEPIPEQCIPKAEPEKESYQVKFPLLAGIIE